MNIGGPWLMQSLIGMLILVPGWLAIGFFGRNYQLSSDIFVVWYFLGGGVGAALFGRTPFASLIPSGWVVASAFLLGVLICGSSNILIFRAVASAPNPGLPVAIINASSILVFFASAGLAWIAPRFFDAVTIDLRSFIGVVLTIAGVAFIAIR
jgi:hypothetical protein